MGLMTDLLNKQEEIAARGEFTKAIWFIDRHSDYCKSASPFLYNHLCANGFQEYLNSVSLVYSYTKDEIVRQILDCVEIDGLTLKCARQVWPVCQPGIWCVKTSGPPEQIKIRNDA